MRVAITGASGNVGTSLLHALASRPDVDSILGLARRPPAMAYPKTTWTHADVASSDLVPLFRSCDAVVHLRLADPAIPQVGSTGESQRHRQPAGLRSGRGGRGAGTYLRLVRWCL